MWLPMRNNVVELVFVTVPTNTVDDLESDPERVLDDGITDRKGHSYVVLHQGSEGCGILDDGLEATILLDYTVFTLEW
jgi:hypothetical protein